MEASPPVFDDNARTVAAVDAFVASRLPSWYALFRRLVRERSVFEQEQRIVELVTEHVTALGLDVTAVPHDATLLESFAAAQPPFSREAGRSSLVIRVPGRRRGRSLALNTHLDIVPEGNPSAWTHPPFAAHVDEAHGILYGRGAMDDKAGVTIALAVLETLVRAPVPLDGDVLFYFVLEDEMTGNGSLLCLEAGHVADAAVIIDGTRPDRIIDSHAGQIQFDIRVKGKPAPLVVSHLGINAGDVIARLVAYLHDEVLALNATREDPWRQFPSPFQLVTQRLACDADVLTVPEYAEATCHMTFAAPWTLARVRQFLKDATAGFAASHRLEAMPVVAFNGIQAEPVTAHADALIDALRQSIAAAGYGVPTVGPSTGTSDLRHFEAARIPCVLYGPGSGFNPHRPDEHYRLEDLPRMVKVFVALAASWCGRSTSAA